MALSGLRRRPRSISPTERIADFEQIYSSPARSITVSPRNESEVSRPSSKQRLHADLWRTWGRAEWMRGPVPLDRFPKPLETPYIASWGIGPQPGYLDRSNVTTPVADRKKVDLRITMSDMPAPSSDEHLPARLTAWSAEEATQFYRMWLLTRRKKKKKKKKSKSKKSEEEERSQEPKEKMKRPRALWSIPSIDGPRLNETMYVGRREYFSHP